MKIETLLVPGWHRVVRATDERRGLRSVIAVHDITLGPAVGGIRMWKYKDEGEALTDALRLSEGMTYKSAIANTGLGGGKSVIIGDSRTDKTPALFEAFGEFLNTLGGEYVAAEDVGISVADIATIAKTSPHVAGLPIEVGGSGDPSPYTALGTLRGIQACLQEAFGSPDLKGRRVLVQGIGHVGSYLVKHLRAEGAEVLIADIHPDRVQALAAEVGATVVDPAAVIGTPCDVFAPCALGAILNDVSIPKLACKIVAGAANNQLAEERHGEALQQRGILYAPDYVINAGGIIAVGVGLRKEGFDPKLAHSRADNIREAVHQILVRAKEHKIPTNIAANLLARERLEAARNRASGNL